MVLSCVMFFVIFLSMPFLLRSPSGSRLYSCSRKLSCSSSQLATLVDTSWVPPSNGPNCWFQLLVPTAAQLVSSGALLVLTEAQLGLTAAQQGPAETSWDQLKPVKIFYLGSFWKAACTKHFQRREKDKLNADYTFLFAKTKHMLVLVAQ